MEYCYMENRRPLREPKVPSTISSSPCNPRFGEIEEIEDQVTKKFKLFKRFDIVSESYPIDHHFVPSQSTQRFDIVSDSYPIDQQFLPWQSTPRKSISSITVNAERTILQEKLPNSIFVRAYSERKDLMRAVIVGRKGTPYHNCLFFFDIQFPNDYPAKPPKLYYYSHDLDLNPNLCFKGDGSLRHEKIIKGKWIPGQSTLLNYLVSIQDLVLNEKPYLNKHGYGNKLPSPTLENKSKAYNRYVMMLSFKAMLYTIRKPPRHFKDFVAGHFRERSHDILMACKACMRSDEDKRIFMVLIRAFEANGSYCKHFLCHIKGEQTVARVSDPEENKDGYGKKIFSEFMNLLFG